MCFVTGSKYEIPAGIFNMLFIYVLDIFHNVDEQVARQRLGQHWFITAYIEFFIQGLYTVYNGAGVQHNNIFYC